MFKLDVLERFHKDVKRDFHPAVTIKINKSEMDLLLVLNEVPKQPFRFYGRHIHLEKSSLSYIIDLLVLKELVIKIEDVNDKRKKTLELTSKGLEIVEELNTQYDDYYKNRISIYSEEELVKLKEAVAVIKVLSKKMKDFIDSDDNKLHFKDHKPGH